MGNYSSAFAIISALNSEPITNLSETVKALDKKYRTLLDELGSMFKSASRYDNSPRYPCLPYLGEWITTALRDQTVIVHPKIIFFVT